MSPAPKGHARAKEFFASAIPWSWLALVQQILHANPRSAFLQPAVGLLIDGPLHQGFLDEITRGFKRRRGLAPRFRSLHYPLFVKLLHVFFFDLDRGAKSGVEVIAQVELRLHHRQQLLAAQPAVPPAILKLGRLRK